MHRQGNEYTNLVIGKQQCGGYGYYVYKDSKMKVISYKETVGMRILYFEYVTSLIVSSSTSCP